MAEYSVSQKFHLNIIHSFLISKYLQFNHLQPLHIHLSLKTPPTREAFLNDFYVEMMLVGRRNFFLKVVLHVVVSLVVNINTFEICIQRWHHVRTRPALRLAIHVFFMLNFNWAWIWQSCRHLAMVFWCLKCCLICFTCWHCWFLVKRSFCVFILKFVHLSLKVIHNKIILTIFPGYFIRGADLGRINPWTGIVATLTIKNLLFTVRLHWHRYWLSIFVIILIAQIICCFFFHFQIWFHDWILCFHRLDFFPGLIDTIYILFTLTNTISVPFLIIFFQKIFKVDQNFK